MTSRRLGGRWRLSSSKGDGIGNVRICFIHERRSLDLMKEFFGGFARERMTLSVRGVELVHSKVMK